MQSPEPPGGPPAQPAYPAQPGYPAQPCTAGVPCTALHSPGALHSPAQPGPPAQPACPAQPGCPAQPVSQLLPEELARQRQTGSGSRPMAVGINCSQRMDPRGWGGQTGAVIVLPVRLSSRTGRGCFSTPLHTPTHDTQSTWGRGRRSPSQPHLLCPYCVHYQRAWGLKEAQVLLPKE